jgi:hypothetical protein
MSTRPSAYVFQANQCSYNSGAQVAPDVTDGDAIVTILAGKSLILNQSFTLPRAQTASKGARLDAVLINYTLTSGTLTSVTPLLQRRVFADSVAPTATTVALNAAAPGFDLTATASTRARNAVTTPAWDDTAAGFDVGAAGRTIMYRYQVTFTASADANVVLTIYNVEFECTTDWA